ncbi:HIT family protein [Streptomyces sp. NBC_00443]|uniref:HIT family protein n=1 Tax=Streptomyces sp. NBC_00443 TaxID=2975743 RepID=UPI002E22655D
MTGSEEDLTLPEQPCPFCEIVVGRAPAALVVHRDYWSDAMAIVPLNPVTEGHTLIIPKAHVPDFAADPEVAAATMRRAAELVRWTPRAMNVITSRGREATQSVFHLHLHLVPRAEGDGLALPWYSGKSRGQIYVRPDPPHVVEAIRDIRRFGTPPQRG